MYNPAARSRQARAAMSQRTLRATLLWIAAGFFALGLASVLLRPSAPSAATATSTDEPTPAPDAPQSTALILGVDDLGSSSPQLLAVWLAAHRPPGRAVYLFGLTTDTNTADGAKLTQAFSWKPGSGPSREFLSAVASLSPVALDVVVVMDETAFAALIDFLGGVELEGGVVGGREVIGVMGLLTGDAAASLDAQGRLLEALAQRAGQVGPGTELKPLADLVPEHLYLSIPTADALTRLAPLLPLDRSNIHISLPLPNEES
ncbi:MAG TPA: hypothetical protein VLD63_09370 [Anaerolineales bacterium]|nr:hypothetical protein [Anaerolineales bacterium]